MNRLAMLCIDEVWEMCCGVTFQPYQAVECVVLAASEFAC